MKDTQFYVNWEVDDGYVGGARPHQTVLTLDEFEEDMLIEDIKEVIFKAVQQDFEENIHWVGGNIEEVAEQVRIALEILEEESRNEM